MESRYSLRHRSDLQGLRAVAILLVVLNHALVPGFTGGFIGVDVFFVLSGFLITGILVREQRQTGSIAYPAFLARRLKRLFPALVFMLVLVWLLAPLLMSRYEYLQQTASAPFASTWTSNLYFAFSHKDYFAELQTRDVFLHTWSLGLEEQFYIFWPALLLVALAIAGWKRGGRISGTGLLTVFSLYFICSFALSRYWAEQQPLWAFYLMPSRIWQFALGASVFVWVDGNGFGKDKFLAQRKWLLVGGTILIVGSAMLLHQNISYPGYWAILPSLGAVLVIASGSSTVQSGNNGILSHPILVWIGDRSYSWYLWHWPVLVLGLSWFADPGPIVITGLVLISLLLAAMSYRYVELPFWKGRLSTIPPTRTILTSILVMLVAVVMLPIFHSWLGSGKRAMPSKFEIAREDGPVFYRMGCDSWYRSAELRPCIASAPTSSRTVVMFGDSVGAQWFSLLPGIYKSPPWRFIVLTKSSCPIVDEDYFYDRIGKLYKVCNQWREAALDYLVSIKPDVIFIGNSTTYGFSRQQWIKGSERILRRLAPVAGKIVIIPGTQAFNMNGPSCLEKKSREKCIQKIPPTAYVKTVSGFLQKAAERFSNVKVLDLNDLVCPEGICAAETDTGIVVYRDSMHLTDTFVRAQIPVVLHRLTRLGIRPANLQ